jgi:hypothetical protein
MRKVVVALRDAWKRETKDPDRVENSGSDKYCGSPDSKEDSKRRKVGMMFWSYSQELINYLLLFLAVAEDFLCLAEMKGVFPPSRRPWLRLRFFSRWY